MDAKTFRVHHPDINVTMDWSRIEREDWSVRYRTVDVAAQLGRLYTAFRISAGLVSVRWLRRILARQLTVADAAERLSQFRPRDCAQVHKLRNAFAQQDHVSLTLPALALPEGNALLLDGNHRALALYLSGTPFTLTFNALEGPISKKLCPDIPYCSPNPRFFA